MKFQALLIAASLIFAAAPALAAQGDRTAEEGAHLALAKFMAAWSAGDAKALAALFAPDADFINPWGTHARGRDEIGAFYAGAFARGFAGSKGEGDLVSVRTLSKNTLLVDGRWRITGAKNEDGTPRPDEKGILAAVLQKGDAGWQILALRENTSATDIVPLAKVSN